MNSRDTKELCSHLIQFRGLSKGQAMAYIKSITDAVKTGLLKDFRARPSPNEFVSIEQLKKSGAAYFPPEVSSPKPIEHASTQDDEPPKKQKKIPYTLLMSPAELERLKDLAVQDGETVSFHIRQAVRQYLNKIK
jgi:hypothetical protein